MPPFVLVVLLAAVALAIPPRPDPAVAAEQTDSLWAGNGGNVGVCASPAAAESLAECFAAPAAIWPFNVNHEVATDGVNVYFAGSTTSPDYGGGLSCPISGMGTDCNRISAGPWDSAQVTSLAADTQYLYIGQSNGLVYRCPNDLPYTTGSRSPAGCVQLTFAGDRAVDSLLLANDTLYAGLGFHGSATNSKQQGMLWACDPRTQGTCPTLDYYGETWANSIVAGGGYLWLGLQNGTVLRCDPTAPNSCTTWANSSGKPVLSLSYDGSDTLYAAVAEYVKGAGNGVIWSCPTGTKNKCSNVLSKISEGTVAAGAGGVFSSNGIGKYLSFGPSGYTHANTYPPGDSLRPYWIQSALLYVPAGGPTGVGAVSASVAAPPSVIGQRLTARCRPTRRPPVRVTVESFAGNPVTHRVDGCRLRNGGPVRVRTFDLLDPGRYTVTARTSGFRAKRTVTVRMNRTTRVALRLSPTGRG